MNTKTKLLVSGFIALSLVLSIAALKKQAPILPSPQPTVEVGAVSPFSPIPEVNLGGSRLAGKAMNLAQGTSTVCKLQSPAATSTLVYAGVTFRLASTSAVVVDMANSPDQYATTTGTRINSSGYAVGASKQATIVASSTGSVAGDATIFAPNRWFVVKFHDPNVASNNNANASTGQCDAVWSVI